MFYFCLSSIYIILNIKVGSYNLKHYENNQNCINIQTRGYILGNKTLTKIKKTMIILFGVFLLISLTAAAASADDGWRDGGWHGEGWHGGNWHDGGWWHGGSWHDGSWDNWHHYQHQHHYHHHHCY